MRILIHEWCCSGGLADAGGGGPAADLPAEGLAMFAALVRDACRDPRLAITAMVDAARPVRLPPGVRTRAVPAGDEIGVLRAEAALADAVLVVAPESAGLLARRVAVVRDAGADAVACDIAFIEVAADKQATWQALAAAGVPVPAGRLLAAGCGWPAGFVRPAVAKPLDGVGGDGLCVVSAADPVPIAGAAARRIEAFVAGEPVGVPCLCGPLGLVPLAPMRQLFAGPGRRYRGGEPLADAPAAARARGLAMRAIEAVARASGGRPRGWVGVDMILGHRADGRGDRVLEVNPRLTTSFVGHAAGADTSLVATLLDVAAGRPVSVASQPRAFRLAETITSTPD